MSGYTEIFFKNNRITLRGEGFDEKIIFGILAPGD
jgi:hypothetical protein